MLHDRLWSILRPCVLQAGHTTVKVVWHLEGLHLPPEPSIVQVVVVNVFAFHVQRGLKRAQDRRVRVELVLGCCVCARVEQHRFELHAYYIDFVTWFGMVLVVCVV